MDGVHDLGGMQDFGPVVVEPGEPVFHADWEGRVFGLVAIVGLHGLYSVNSFRHAIERMDPAHYLSSPYFEHWLTALATLMVEHGSFDRGELQRRAGGPFPLAHPSLATGRQPTADEQSHARFAVGDAVRVREMHPRGHTRCPRYIRGKRGTVERRDGAFVLPDAEVHGEEPPRLETYCVRFQASELWGEEAEPGASVSVDVWDSYLEGA